MSVDTILEEARNLSQEELKELTRRLIDMIQVLPPETAEPDEHWGKSLNRLLDEIGPIEMLYPEIEDPVEWVKHLRAEQRRRRLGDWGEDE